MAELKITAANFENEVLPVSYTHLDGVAAVQRDADLRHTHGVHQGAVVGGEHMAVLEQDLAVFA